MKFELKLISENPDEVTIKQQILRNRGIDDVKRN